MWNELCVPDSVSVVSKTFFIYTLNTSNVIFVSFKLNYKLHPVSVGKLTERCQILGQFGFSKLNLNRVLVFCTPLETNSRERQSSTYIFVAGDLGDGRRLYNRLINSLHQHPVAGRNAVHLYPVPVVRWTNGH